MDNKNKIVTEDVKPFVVITKEMEERDLSNSAEFIIENLEESPYYNNEEYYLNGTEGYSSKDGEERITFLFSRVALKAVWKAGVVQKFMKWVVNGLATAAMVEIAFNGLPKVKASTNIGYGYTEAGNAVKTCQLLLWQHGAFPEADGYYGPSTKKSIEQFQRTHGLVADGICGPKTWDKLINGNCH